MSPRRSAHAKPTHPVISGPGVANSGSRRALTSLSAWCHIRRRYSRSINIARDLAVPDSLDGYVVTDRASEFLQRAVQSTDAGATIARAWTITGVYGTGKSALGHLLAAMCGPTGDPSRKRAARLLAADARTADLVPLFRRIAGSEGFLRIIVTAGRESLSLTLARATATAAAAAWGRRRGKRPRVLGRLELLVREGEQNGQVPSQPLLEALVELGAAWPSGLLIVVDELGKALEHAARSAGADDLYLLQQLTELPTTRSHGPLLVVGLLHQSFSAYAAGLAAVERAEWEKVHGRFEDVVFDESPEEILRLTAAAIEADWPSEIERSLRRTAQEWRRFFTGSLFHPYVSETLTEERIVGLYPLHPVAALALPTLCSRYAQNDRSLFTFLAGEEPHAFGRFLREVAVSEDGELPTLRLGNLYDYFLDTATTSGTGPAFQRWVEVHALVKEAEGLESDALFALKTIGVLNLLTTAGPLRASRALVLAAVSDTPADADPSGRWARALDSLVARGVVTYREQIDEYRLWAGSDFDVPGAINAAQDRERQRTSALLEQLVTLPPIVAQRHSYEQGTLRYFERRFADDLTSLNTIALRDRTADGVVLFWVGTEPLDSAPPLTIDGRPLVVVPIPAVRPLDAAARELAALNQVASLPRLRLDGVARREVTERIAHAKAVLDRAVADAFAAATSGTWWVSGKPVAGRPLARTLSALCDETYANGPRLWNELINRREPTGNGVRARSLLLTALLTETRRERLGITGFGPEYSIYASVLAATGIHRPGEHGWEIGPPSDARMLPVWQEIERFCTDAESGPRAISDLLEILGRPPFGVKEGVIPVLLTAGLVYHADDVSVYRDGTFLPVLTSEHLELLTRQPHRFAVKHFALAGLRLEVFKELQDLLDSPQRASRPEVRNATVLSVVRPLVRFVAELPKATRTTRRISHVAQSVREALQSATEPDELIFFALPRACGLAPFAPACAEPSTSENTRLQLSEFRVAIRDALRELQGYYDSMIESAGDQVHEAFGVRSGRLSLRTDLRTRAQYLLGRVIEPRLRMVVGAAADPHGTDRQWLEALLMVVADRPPESWSDDDRTRFELNLSDIARRFAHMEAIQRAGETASRTGFDARRVTVTRPDGTETHQLIWVDEARRPALDARVARLVEEIANEGDEHEQQAIATLLVERLLTSSAVRSGRLANASMVEPGARRRGDKP